jgi:hypothetical protein
MFGPSLHTDATNGFEVKIIPIQELGSTLGRYFVSI